MHELSGLGLGGHVEKCALAAVPAGVVYSVRKFFLAAATPAREWDGLNRGVANRVGDCRDVIVRRLWGSSRPFGPGGQETINYDLDGREVDFLGAKYVVARQLVGGAGTTERFNSLGQIVTRESSGLKGATVIESFRYDSRNRLQIQTRPHLAGDVTQGGIYYFYDEQDQLVSESFPDGTILRQDHALAALLKPEFASFAPTASRAVTVVRSQDASKNSTLAFMDRDGRTVEMVDANNRATNYPYGAFNDLRQIVGPNGSLTYDYDNYGRMLSSTDAALGGTATATYNGLDEIISSLDPANRATSIYYDELGRTKRVETADGTTTFSYDVGANAIGQLTQTVGPTGQQTDYTYEPKGSGKNRGLLSSITKSLLPPGANSSTTPTKLTTTFHLDEFSRLRHNESRALGYFRTSVRRSARVRIGDPEEPHRSVRTKDRLPAR